MILENMVNGLGRQVSDRTMETFLAVGEACIAILSPMMIALKGEDFTALGSQHRGP